MEQIVVFVIGTLAGGLIGVWLGWLLMPDHERWSFWAEWFDKRRRKQEMWSDERGDAGTPVDGNPDILRMRDGSVVHKGKARDDYMALMAKYPDHKALCATNKFISWYLSQEPEVGMLGQTFDPKDAMRLLDIYHERTGAQPDLVH